MKFPKIRGMSFEMAAAACATAFGAGALCMYFFDAEQGSQRRSGLGERLTSAIDAFRGSHEEEIARDEQAMNLCAIDGDSHTTDVLLDKLEITKSVEGIEAPPMARP